MKSINKVEDQQANELELMHSYQDACANKEFRAYVEQLPIEEEILRKYTSNLEDALIEFKNIVKYAPEKNLL